MLSEQQASCMPLVEKKSCGKLGLLGQFLLLELNAKLIKMAYFTLESKQCQNRSNFNPNILNFQWIFLE